MLLIEHKSAGEDLERAFAQASAYFDRLLGRDLPRYILVSDFAHFRLYDLEADTTIEFRLSELHQKVRHFGFIAGCRTQEIEPQNPVKGNRNKLFDFHKRRRTLTVLDPACGCGNFLVITYRELRKLELEILRASLALERESGQRLGDIQQLATVDVAQFYGIEIEEFPAQIAQVALWLVDHQMNTLISEEFGNCFARIPLTSAPRIHNNRRPHAATRW